MNLRAMKNPNSRSSNQVADSYDGKAFVVTPDGVTHSGFVFEGKLFVDSAPTRVQGLTVSSEEDLEDVILDFVVSGQA